VLTQDAPFHATPFAWGTNLPEELDRVHVEAFVFVLYPSVFVMLPPPTTHFVPFHATL
jgi:hypothetical protein